MFAGIELISHMCFLISGFHMNDAQSEIEFDWWGNPLSNPR